MKLVAFILSITILIQGVNITYNDILNLDEFIEHAQFHKEQHGDTFFKFLSKHYGKLKEQHTKENQEEKSEHEQLPFQKEYCYCLEFSRIASGFPEIKFNSVTFFIEKKDVFFYQNNYTSPDKLGLFQPPRNA